MDKDTKLAILPAPFLSINQRLLIRQKLAQPFGILCGRKGRLAKIAFSLRRFLCQNMARKGLSTKVFSGSCSLKSLLR
jgi:hypothetical protein